LQKYSLRALPTELQPPYYFYLGGLTGLEPATTALKERSNFFNRHRNFFNILKNIFLFRAQKKPKLFSSGFCISWKGF